MTSCRKNITGYILAGGKSSRMGEDKGLKLLAGKTLIEAVIAQLQPEIDKVVIVSNNMEYRKFGLEVTEDLIKDLGPAGGIYTALQHSKTAKNFILSCDMPFVKSAAISFIIENSDQAEITLVENNGRLEPLFGVYGKKCSPKWKLLIENNNVKLQDLVKHFNVKKISVNENNLFSEDIFLNINTPKDFKNALNKSIKW